MKTIHRLLLALILSSVSVVSAQTPTPNPDTILEDCAAALPANRPIPAGESAPTIRIVSPVSGTVIQSDDDQFAEVVFTVAVENFELDEDYGEAEGNHWHLWLNNSVWGMYGQTTVTSWLMYGTWRVCASLGDAEHTDIGMPDAILLTVEKTGTGEARVTVQPAPSPMPSTPSPPAPPPETDTAGSGLSPLLVLGLGGVALAAGLWLGGRRAR